MLMLASSLKLVKDGNEISQMTDSPSSLLIDTVVSFIIALGSITWLPRSISSHNFRPLTYYRVVPSVGILVLVAGKIA